MPATTLITTQQFSRRIGAIQTLAARSAAGILREHANLGETFTFGGGEQERDR
jgi:hypothetical protein